MAGVDLKTVQELLAHRTFDMTLRYSHLSPDHKRKAVDIFNKRLGTIWTPSQASAEEVDVARSSELSYDDEQKEYAGVAELADALHSKKANPQTKAKSLKSTSGKPSS